MTLIDREIPATKWIPEPRPIVREDHFQRALARWRDEVNRLLSNVLAHGSEAIVAYRLGYRVNADRHADLHDEWLELYSRVLGQRPKQAGEKGASRG